MGWKKVETLSYQVGRYDVLLDVGHPFFTSLLGDYCSIEFCVLLAIKRIDLGVKWHFGL